MAITGLHALLYTPAADELRAIFRDAVGWESVDAGGGWLIFAGPPSELAVHPAAEPRHEITLMCDDIGATVEELRSKGLEFASEPEDQGWGITATMLLPGGVDAMLYEPRHPTAIPSPPREPPS